MKTGDKVKVLDQTGYGGKYFGKTGTIDSEYIDPRFGGIFVHMGDAIIWVRESEIVESP